MKQGKTGVGWQRGGEGGAKGEKDRAAGGGKDREIGTAESTWPPQGLKAYPSRMRRGGAGWGDGWDGKGASWPRGAVNRPQGFFVRTRNGEAE